MMDSMLNTLRSGLPELGVTIPEGADETLCKFGCELIEQNKVMNLTAITEPEAVAKLHLLDSLTVLTAADLAGKKAGVEGGSAGAATAADFTDADKIFKATSQIAAFPELKSGAVDFIVCDIVLARNLCGEGGNYTDLAIVEGIELDSEIYAVGFRKGSDLTAKVNAAIKELEANGKLLEIATKYGFENVLSVTETIE